MTNEADVVDDTTNVEAPPRLRRDVVLTRHAGSSSAPFVAKDPRTRSFFRFREAEHFVLTQLDGDTTLAEVCARVDERFGATLPETTLREFVQRLNGLGLLDDGMSAPTRTSRSRLQGNALFLRFKLFDPDRLLGRMIGPLEALFSRAFVVVTIALVGLAAIIAVSNTVELAQAFARHLTLHSVLVAWVVIALVGFVHECAHGLACKRYGGEVHEIGALLIFLTPAFYCDVSDAWLFPHRRQRLLVTAVGPYVELVLWALATVVWRVTNPGTVPNWLALVILAATGFKVLLNLNPFIKLDGYYLLSDGLGIPNLRDRSFTYLRGLVRGSPAPAEPRGRQRIYVVYGILAIAFALWMLWFIAARLGGALIPRFQAWGLLAFVLLFGAIFRTRLQAITGGATMRGRVVSVGAAMLGAGRRLVDGTRALAGRARAASPAPPTPLAPRRRLRRVTLATLGLIVAGFMLVEIELRVAGEFRVLPTRNADARPEIEGLVAQVYVREGMEIAEGQLVARLSDRDILAELRKTEASIAEQAALVRMLEVGLAREETSAVKAEERLRFKRNDLQRMRDLFQREFIAKRDLERAEEEAVVREKEVAEARLTAGTRREQIVSVKAEIERLRAHHRYFTEHKRLTSIVSRLGGVVTTPERQLRDLVGRHVSKGDLIASVHRLDRVTAEMVLSERDIGDVATGQRVAVKARAYPDLTFAGTVSSVAAMVRPHSPTPLPAPPLANAHPSVAPPMEEGGADRIVLVTTEIENPGRLLKPEMTGRAKIGVGDRSVFHILTRRLARVIRVEFWSWW